ncbi:MAG: flagellar hook-basal body complex protein FliE [Myxococcales bacterium]|nr:flagellar hook-basal body complex protein FliE [Myxococcales bacterium]
MSAIDASTLQLLRPHQAIGPEVKPLREAPEPEGTFGPLLDGAIRRVNDAGHAGSRAGEAFAAGAVDDIHGTMLALSKADIELRYAGAVRNKVIDAFYELWRMQI